MGHHGKHLLPWNRMKKVVVVGGGLAGLSAAMRLAENGCHIKLISVTKVKRSHSVCAQGGINASLSMKGEEDSPLDPRLRYDQRRRFFSQSTSNFGDVHGSASHHPDDGPLWLSLQQNSLRPSRCTPFWWHALPSNGLLWRIELPAAALYIRRTGAPFRSQRNG